MTNSPAQIQAAAALHAMAEAVESLRVENDVLRERLQASEAGLGQAPAFPRAWGLTPTEARLVALLLKADRRVVPRVRASILIATGLQQAEVKTIDVHVSRVRKKLRAALHLPHDPIETMHRTGIRLSHAAHAAIVRRLEEATTEETPP